MNPLSLTFGTAAHASASSLHSVPMEAQLLVIGVIFLGTLIVNRFSIRIGVPAILGAREHWATATALPSTRKTRATASNKQSKQNQTPQSKPKLMLQSRAASIHCNGSSYDLDIQAHSRLINFHSYPIDLSDFQTKSDSIAEPPQTE